MTASPPTVSPSTASPERGRSVTSWLVPHWSGFVLHPAPPSFPDMVHLGPQGGYGHEEEEEEGEDDLQQDPIFLTLARQLASSSTEPEWPFGTPLRIEWTCVAYAISSEAELKAKGFSDKLAPEFLAVFKLRSIPIRPSDAERVQLDARISILSRTAEIFAPSSELTRLGRRLADPRRVVPKSPRIPFELWAEETGGSMNGWTTLTSEQRQHWIHASQDDLKRYGEDVAYWRVPRYPRNAYTHFFEHQHRQGQDAGAIGATWNLMRTEGSPEIADWKARERLDLARYCSEWLDYSRRVDELVLHTADLVYLTNPVLFTAWYAETATSLHRYGMSGGPHGSGVGFPAPVLRLVLEFVSVCPAASGLVQSRCDAAMIYAK